MALDELARLRAMFARLGGAWPATPDADALAALDRCRKCHYRKLCDEFLADPLSNAARMFCPNTHYIQIRRHCSLI